MKINKVNYFFERSYKSFIFWILIFLSTFLIIKTSEEPILPFFAGSFIEVLFQKFDFSNKIINDISIGYIVSAIFYFVVVYLPEKQKRKDIDPFIRNKCESIIFGSYALFQEIIKSSKLDYEYQTLTEEEFLEMCKVVNPKENKHLFHDGFNNNFEQHLGYSLYNHWSRISAEIDETLRFLLYIDSGIIKRLNNINGHYIKYTIKGLSAVEKIGNTSLEAWSMTFYEFYILSKEFRDYYILYSKSKFNNDPWK